MFPAEGTAGTKGPEAEDRDQEPRTRVNLRLQRRNDWWGSGHQGGGWRTYSDPREVGGLGMSGSRYAMGRNWENTPLAAGRDTGLDRSLGSMKLSS